MKISYAIPVCNEVEELKRLLERLDKYISEEDEIVILIDEHNHDPRVLDVVDKENISVVAYHELNSDFASHKNHLNELCSGDWIFQIDADEFVAPTLLTNIKDILDANKHVDLIWVPRENIVEGITEGHIKKWRWHQDQFGRINYPDYQSRLYKNESSIKWKNKVHEKIVGAKTVSYLPKDMGLDLIHRKDISRQERQNEFYETIQ